MAGWLIVCCSVRLDVGGKGNYKWLVVLQVRVADSGILRFSRIFYDIYVIFLLLRVTLWGRRLLLYVAVQELLDYRLFELC